MPIKCSRISASLSLAFAIATGFAWAQKEMPMPAGMPMGSVAPLVIQSADWESFITIVNESKSQAHVQLMLRLKDGMPYGSQTIVLPGHSSRQVTVASLLNSPGEDFIGSLTAVVQEPSLAKNMAVAAQLTIVDKSRPNGASIDEELEMPEMGAFKSVASGPATLLALQNPGMTPALVTLTCLDHGSLVRVNLAVAPNALRLVDRCAPLDQSQTPSTSILSALHDREPHQPASDAPRAFELSSPMSEITVFGVSAIFRDSVRRLSSVIFASQNDITSTSTVFAGIPVGPYSALPGSIFKPTLAIANFTNVTRRVVVKGSTGSGALNVLSSVLLKPFEVRNAEVPAPAASEADLGAIVVDQDGHPGDVITTLTDEDKVDQTTLTPVPKFMHPAQNGGGHPWSLEPETTSAVVVYNAGANAQKLNFNLGADGLIWKKTVEIQPYELLNLKIKDIIDSINAEPTRKSKITALHGEISWFSPSQGDIFGRTLIAHAGNGRRSVDSYSCGDYIVLCGLNVDPGSVDIVYGFDGYLSASPEYCTSWSGTDCSGDDYGPGSADTYSWESDDSSTTPISGSSDEESVELYGAGLGSGGANVFAYAGTCEASGGGGATVEVPDHLWVNTDTQGAISTCSSGKVGWIRKITYGIQDVHNNFLSTDIGVEESFSSKSNGGVNTCTKAQVPTSQTCTSTAVSGLYSGDQTGFFTDIIATGCAPPVAGCGFTFTGQVWSWCSGSGEPGPSTPQPLAAIGTIVATQSDITVAGTQHLTQGTVPPK